MDIRQRLSQIAHIDNSLEQIKQMNELKRDYNLSIELIEQFDSDHKYNCFMHAFDLTDSDLVYQTAQETMHHRNDSSIVFPDSSFSRYLIDNNLLEETQEPRDGDICIYFSDINPVHAGKTQNDFVISKWGGKGNLWKHALFEIPQEYGGTCKVYGAVQKAVSESWFRRYIGAPI